MAFQTGSQINPALGRTDFTPFLQGAMQGAQAQARGAENIAAGLAGLGQQVASGIEKYYKKEEEKKLKQQGVDYLVQNYGVTPEAAAAGFNAIGAIPFTNLLEFKRKEQYEINKQNRIASYFNALNQAGGMGVNPEGGPVSPAEEMAARQSFAALQKTESETFENLVNKTKPVTTVYPTAEAARKAGEDANPGLIVQVVNAPGGFTFTASQKIVPDDETKFRLESFGKEVDRIMQAGEAARQVAPAINSLLGLLDSGKLQTGFGEGAKAQMRSVGKAIGFPIDEAALGNAQQANAMFGQMILQYYQQTKGSISNAENILFQSFGPELGKSPEANKAILTFSKKRNELDRDLEKIAKDYRLGKLDRQQAQEKIVSRQEKYDNDIGSLIPDAPAATRVRVYNPATGTFNP